jgi:hypothetical protein
MATETSVIHAALNALQTQIAAEMAATSGYETVEVFSGDMGGETPREAVLFFGTEDASQEWSTIGNLRKGERFTIDYAIWIVKPGAGETVIREARDRAVDIMAVIETYLRKSTVHGDAVNGITLQGTVNEASIEPRRLLQGMNTEGRWCQLDGGIVITKRLRKG